MREAKTSYNLEWREYSLNGFPSICNYINFKKSTIELCVTPISFKKLHKNCICLIWSIQSFVVQKNKKINCFARIIQRFISILPLINSKICKYDPTNPKIE